jgi:signal transduction histidine kinase
MAELATASERGRSFAVVLNQLSSRTDKLEGIRDVLSLYVRHFNAFGAALWEVAEDVGPERKGRLFLQAQYFENRDEPPFYHLPTSSVSGRCIRLNEPARRSRKNDSWDNEIETYPHVLDELEIDSFVSIPIQLSPDSPSPADATITVYKKMGEFSEEQFDSLKDAALLFPAVYRSIQARASLILLKRVQTVLRTASYIETPQALDKAKEAMAGVLEIISAHFQFVESTIYLHNPLTDPPNVYGRIAERWPWSKPSRDSYVPGDGGTGWVLKNGKPLRFFDMARFADDRDYYREKYSDMEWPDRVGIREEVERYFKLPPGDIFPLSYACVPILQNRTVKGALRCRISRNGPYHVDEDIMSALASAAEMIADWWDHWTREQQQHHDQIAATSIMTSLSLANRSVIQNWHLTGAIARIIASFLEICRRSVPQADVVEVWLHEPRARIVRKADQPERTASLADAPRPVSDPSRSVIDTSQAEQSPIRPNNAFQYALSTSSVLHLAEAGKSPFFVPSIANAVSFTVAPVIARTGSNGVLVFASSAPVPWPATISNAASFLAEQLALYLAAHQQILAFNHAQSRLQNSVQEQADLLLDFQHQLRTPINIARNSAEQLRKYAPGGQEWAAAFDALTSSTLRAGTVANNLQFFVSLAQGKPVAADNRWLTVDEVLRGIERASEFLYNRGAFGRQLNFVFPTASPSMSITPMPRLHGDPNLIALAADNLMDNAVKYSFENTSIEIRADAGNYGREVYLSFRNQGLRITPEEAPDLKKRKHRGKLAEVTSPEGTGIGLWMVSELMRSMDGRLEIHPTDAKGWNDFRLYFRGSAQ